MSRQIGHEALDAFSLTAHFSSSPNEAYCTIATLTGLDASDSGEGLLADNYVHGLLDMADHQAIDGEGAYQNPNMPERLAEPKWHPSLLLENRMTYPLLTDTVALVSDQTSLETKKLMFSVIVDKILPYRYGDGARSFPCVAFYETLLYNEASRDVKKFGAECAAWFGQLTVGEADHYSATITEYHQSLRWAVSTCQQKVTASEKKKTRKSAKTSCVTDHHNQLLKTELKKPLTIGYDALIDDLEEASILDRAYLQHLRQTSTAHVEDPSWPSTKEKRRAYVKQMCGAIFDMGDFQEKKAALGKLAKLEAKHGNTNEADARDEAGSSRKRKLGQEMPKKIPGLSTFDAVFEERWDQICFNMRHHKVTIHSALRGDWLSRLAAGPVGERKMKQGNKSVNSTRDVQNELGRAELKRQKTGASPQSNTN
ncbi:hypothetical protein CGCA056_v005718 [Colletotrichum aenigma]|uniref:uncharacterized protein n=1 Tax=Colletotrichum aenigma TaxID=1215731 RepID=UPI0018732A6C|nr:uncharacterized protein CGCA056_v005718 [Colletotrichum aenigma]KAF5523442.1 hypothetical protein CGCA056_v005718 [Colletotrichum aenigma]